MLHDRKKRKFARKSRGSRGETGKHIGRFPFDLNFRFEFSATSSSEQNSFFQNVQNGDNLARHTQKFLKFFPGVFSVHSSHFGNSTVREISGNFSGKFLYYLPRYLKFSKVFVEWKASSLKVYVKRVSKKNNNWNSHVHHTFFIHFFSLFTRLPRVNV